MKIKGTLKKRILPNYPKLFNSIKIPKNKMKQEPLYFYALTKLLIPIPNFKLEPTQAT
jgi:hypothetical protein